MGFHRLPFPDVTVGLVWSSVGALLIDTGTTEAQAIRADAEANSAAAMLYGANPREVDDAVQRIRPRLDCRCGFRASAAAVACGRVTKSNRQL